MEGKITYEGLIQARRQSMAEAGNADKTIRNAVSYLRKNLMQPAGRADADFIGSELHEQFDGYVERAVISAGANARAVKASLNQWRQAYQELLRSQELPEGFREALLDLFHRHDLLKSTGRLDFTKAAREAGVAYQALRSWVIGESSPAKSSLPHVQSLEKYFKLAPNTLLSRVPRITGLNYSNVNNQRPHKPEQAPYSLKPDEMDASLIEEIEALVRFKSAPASPPGMSRNKTWRIRPLDEWGGSLDRLATVQNGFVPSAHRATQCFCRYFGFLVTEKGVSISDLSLAYIACSDWVYEFLMFLIDRVGGKVTRNVTISTALLASQLHPKWGFISQKEELADKHPSQVLQAEWNAHCEQERAKILGFLDDLKRGNSVVLGRNPQDPIEEILRSKDPLNYLLLFESRHGADGPAETAPVRRLGWKRDRLLIRMMMTNPLRINQYKTMTWRPDNTGNLRKDKDGVWWLVFEPRHFKNEDGAARHRYSAKIDSWAAELIDEYLRDVRPQLDGADVADYVFLRSPAGIKCDRHQISSMNHHIRNLTRTYLYDVTPNGFGPHAFRHIVATALLKAGHHIDVVAATLHDTPETTRERYSHLVADDGIGALSGEISKLRTARMSSRRLV